MAKVPYIAPPNQHVTQGRIAKFAGDKFEAWVEVQHQKALRLGILAHVAHNYAKAEIKKGRLEYAGKGVADYTGTLDRCGLTLAVEAKSVQTDRFMRSGVQAKQAAHLTAVARAGGLALLLLEFRHEVLPLRHAIPWLEVPWIILRSAESIDCSAVAQWRIPRDPEICYLERFHARGESTNKKEQL